ncbi:MAG: PDZ domain-containing protein, partial [Actinomycetota bacterium]
MSSHHLPPPPAPEADGPARPRRVGRRGLALIPLATLAFVMYFVQLPYFVLGPGPARDVEPLIEITGAQVYPSRGHFVLTAVTFDRANVYGLLAAWGDPTRAVLSERDLLTPGRSEEEEARVARSQMDTSKIDAAIVALSRYAGYPANHAPGALVERATSGSPAAGKLFAGDVIVAADGHRVDGPNDLRARIQAAGAGTPIRLTVRGRPGGEARVTVTPARFRIDGETRILIGVVLVRAFPFPISIRSGEIGGPSAGLMWALGLIDLLTPGDLTGGRTIAGTGSIDPTGRVFPVGGVEEKVDAARRVGAKMF